MYSIHPFSINTIRIPGSTSTSRDTVLMAQPNADHAGLFLPSPIDLVKEIVFYGYSFSLLFKERLTVII